MQLLEYPKVTEQVSGRPVIASGQIVLGRHDSEASVQIDDLTFTFAFVPDSGALGADAHVVGTNQIRIRFTGSLGALPVSYELGGVAVWQGWWVDLAAMVSAVEDGPVVRLLNYTFTGGLRTEALDA